MTFLGYFMVTLLHFCYILHSFAPFLRLFFFIFFIFLHFFFLFLPFPPFSPPSHPPFHLARSRGVGFLNDTRRMNVGLTRARDMLIVLGSADTLSRSNAWRDLVQHARGTGTCTRRCLYVVYIWFIWGLCMVYVFLCVVFMWVIYGLCMDHVYVCMIHIWILVWILV